MAHSRGIRSAAAGSLFELEPPARERLELQISPVAETVASYVLTDAAERSWQILNRHLAASAGAVFWIGGRPGCGKTHFLNYVIALENRAGTLEAANKGRMVCGFETAGRVSSAELEFYLLSVIADQVGAEQRAVDLWRDMRGVTALMVALESVGRVGIRALTVAIDFGLSDCASVADFVTTLAQVAQKSNRVKFTVVAAGRDKHCSPAEPLEVAAVESREEISIALRRTRRLIDAAAQIEHAYAGIESGEFEPQAIFPFHPSSVEAIKSIAGPEPTIWGLARVAREALEVARDREWPGRLLYPADLTQVPSIDKLIGLKLTPSAAAALKIARAAIERFDGSQKKLAREIVDALMLHHLRSETQPPMTLRLLTSRVSMLAMVPADESWTMPMVRELLRQLDFYTAGIIRSEAQFVRFDPAAAGAPEVAAYNAALDLLQQFDSSLTHARDNAELQLRFAQLDQALSAAIEGANRTLAGLSAALAESHQELPDAHLIAIANYVALAESGGVGLVALNKDPAQRESAQKICAAYEMLADAAAAVPRMRSMRAYLAATGLRTCSSDNAWQDAATVALETECELLGAELGPRLIAGAIRNINAVEARFHKFKWTYVQRYQDAHERWRLEMDRLLPIVEDAYRYAQALARLDSIAALGPAAGTHLHGRVAELGARVVGCDPRHRPSPDTTPLCTNCGFQLGAHSPREELADLTNHLQRALAVKFDALSQNVVARLIRQQDKEHRLDGFLKIIQASQPDALVRVLDENLARYLAEVLDENLLSAMSDDHAGAIQAAIKHKVSARSKVTRMSLNRRSDR